MIPTITICGSMTFIDDMEALAAALQPRASVLVPDREESQTHLESEPISSLLPLKRRYIDTHLEKIRVSDAVLIANFAKHGVPGYIGPNTLMEAAFAHALGKRVLLLYRPDEQPCRLEILSIAAAILDGDIDRAIPTL